MNKRKITYSLTIIIGTLLILSAAGILIGQAVSNEQQTAATEEILSEMEKLLPHRTPGMPEPHYGNSMPKAEVNGEDFIGLLEIPDYHTKFPVGAVWDSVKHSYYPCAYQGSLYENSLIIGGSNSAGEFDFADDIDIGAKLRFSDLYGQVFTYQVTMVNHVDSESAVTSEGEDFTLFVKSKSSGKYIVIRCRLSEIS